MKAHIKDVAAEVGPPKILFKLPCSLNSVYTFLVGKDTQKGILKIEIYLNSNTSNFKFQNETSK
ncbi:hypothetical protein B0A79_19420 [Flavobacterium piscis]|uniref:Uncharacterized protein n=1 Tax=Flavobacterium piscis TaxID=1114874 RepID=A0ABX2XDI7_9FLAO|nr:hypothetical protein FLP_19970 [Flavobacterium piscis]OXE99206.1 hypothetical protein B0A79_19420 [Flavobacterium piscis]